MPATLPPNAQKYSESPVFTQDTIPDALRRNHQTKKNVWGRIVVSEGTLLYLVDDRPARPISAGETGAIPPFERHAVKPMGDVTFKVEFYRVPNSEVPS